MPFDWWEPERILEELASGMARWKHIVTPEDQTRADLMAAELAAMKACDRCNHSGVRLEGGKIVTCECVAPFRKPLPPLSPGTMGGV